MTPVQAHTVITVSTNGEPFGLRLEGDMLTFCDKRGGRKLDLKTGQDSVLDELARIMTSRILRAVD